MIIFLIFLIILFLIILFYNKNIKEKFDIYGAEPRGLDWGLGTSYSKSEEKNCNPGFLCNTELDFGLFDKDCNCVTLNLSKNKNKKIKSEYNLESESEYELEEESKFKKKCNKGLLCMNKNGIGKYNDNCECILTNTNKKEYKEPGCYPKNTNFDALCKVTNIKNGIKNIIPCNDKNKAKVECGLNYIDGVYYEESILKTPCHNIDTDFDTWCRYYNHTNIPPGYNINSIGSKKLLVGSKGGCYLDNGESDNSMASAICDYNHMDEIKKLGPANLSLDYNIFTNCQPIRGTNFIKDCSKLLNVKYEDAYADQIMGYDCNPGFARAKCIKSKDMKTFNNSLFQNTYDKNNQPVEQINGPICNCPLVS